MINYSSKEEFLQRLRDIHQDLKNLRISNIVIEREKAAVTYNFICDKAVFGELKDKLVAAVEEMTPSAFASVTVTVKKIVASGDLVRNEILKYIRANYPSVAAFLKDGDVTVIAGEPIKYTVRLSKNNMEYFKNDGTLIKINKMLAQTFCADFLGATEEKAVSEIPDLSVKEIFEGELQRINRRTIKVDNVLIIDDVSIGDTALYIEDAKEGEVIVAGRITDITEKMTKTNKPFFIIRIDDTTGIAGGLYFSRKATYGKIKKLAVGDAIIARATVGQYGGKPSFTFNKINGCDFPDSFEKQNKFKKTPPKNYSLIFPEPAETVTVKSVFDVDDRLPKELTEKTFVVFDLETTGIDPFANGITEIGAVKIVGGEIKEQFTTLVNPCYPISKENSDLTGITEDMVKDKPKIGEVLPDFLKFAEGSVLVGHNAAEFDMRFIRRFADEEEYEVPNRVMDTLVMSRYLLSGKGLKKFDLHTVADVFNITFRHHRALSDAYATAQIFIELMKMRYNG